MKNNTLMEDGPKLVRGIHVAELRDAGIEFDAETDADVGPDECRITASLDTDIEGNYCYGVQFRQLSLSRALAGHDPTWVWDRVASHPRYAAKLAGLFTPAEMAEIEESRAMEGDE